MSAIWAIVRKDLRAYYLKPPLISWAIVMPIVLVLALYLRHPEGIGDLLPGLVAMTVLFGATSMEGIVFTSEKQIGALERPFLAPVSLRQILMGKVLGGTVSGAATGTVSGAATGTVSGAATGTVSGAATGTVFGAATGTVMLLIGLVGFRASGPRWETALPALALSSFALSCMAMVLVAGVREVFEAMTLFNYFRFPMVFLCGVFLPVAAMALPLRVVAYVLPLTYVVDGPAGAFTSHSGLLPPGVDLLILGGYSAMFFFCAELVLKRSVRREG